MYSWERVRVRVISNVERLSTNQITLTPNPLPRVRGRGDQRCGGQSPLRLRSLFILFEAAPQGWEAKRKTYTRKVPRSTGGGGTKAGRGELRWLVSGCR